MHEPGAAGLPIVIRSVEGSDRDVLFAWRNDPTAFREYVRANPVTAADHDLWLSDRLAQEPVTLWLAWRGADPCGSVRMDLDGLGSAEISVVVDRRYRGQGIGSILLEWATAAAPGLGVDTLLARIRPGNAASRALFEDAGYVEGVADTAGFIHYEKAVTAE